MTTSTINPSFPDIHTKQDLPVDSYLRLTKSDVAKVYEHVRSDMETSELVIAFEELGENMADLYPKREMGRERHVMDVWDWNIGDYYCMRNDEGIPYPKLGDYEFFTILGRCHDMVPVALEIAKLITGHDDWQEVTNNYHSAVYSPSRRMLYDILADVMGEDAQQHPEATCLDDGSQSGCLPNWQDIEHPKNRKAIEAALAEYSKDKPNPEGMLRHVVYLLIQEESLPYVERIVRIASEPEICLSRQEVLDIMLNCDDLTVTNCYNPIVYLTASAEHVYCDE
tara:strand:- start:522 stop:1367 length:846 start_codon:yes stop_codon:yes gene_type:complete